MGQQRHLTTDAIILKSNNCGEINRNFTFISPSLGIQSATAFGAARIRSSFCSSVQPFVKAKLFLYKSPRSNYLKLDDIGEIMTNDLLKTDLGYIYMVSFFNEVLIDCYICNEEFKNYYYLLSYSIDILMEKKDIKKAFLFFTSKFLFLSGYNFTLSGCKKCRSVSGKLYFDQKEGSVFCDRDSDSRRFPMTESSLRLWKDFLEKKYIHLKDREVNERDFLQIFPVINSLFRELFEKDLKTFKAITEVLVK